MFTVFLVAIVVAANRAEETSDAIIRAGSRGPASANAEIAHAHDDRGALFRHTEKLHGPITVGLDLVGAEPAAGDTFVLKGVISSSERLENVDFHWAVPASVELVNGQSKGTIAVIEADRSVEFELTLRARDGANAQIHLLATGRAHRARFAESAQYNTTRQAALRADRERLMKSTESSQFAPPISDVKVFH